MTEHARSESCVAPLVRIESGPVLNMVPMMGRLRASAMCPAERACYWEVNVVAQLSIAMSVSGPVERSVERAHNRLDTDRP